MAETMDFDDKMWKKLQIETLKDFKETKECIKLHYTDDFLFFVFKF